MPTATEPSRSCPLNFLRFLVRNLLTTVPWCVTYCHRTREVTMKYRLIGTSELGRGVLGAARTINEAKLFSDILTDDTLGNPAQNVVIQKLVGIDGAYSF